MEFKFDEGKAEGKIEIVKAALKKNIDIQIIHELTALSVEEIQNIKKLDKIWQTKKLFKNTKKK